MSRFAFPLALVLVATAITGCSVFDASLYQSLAPPDGGASDTGGPDMGPTDTGMDTDVDAGPPALVDQCTDDGIFVARAGDMFRVSTEGFTDDVTCTGNQSAEGPEGFFAIEVQQGEVWHFHVQARGSADEAPQNPVVYALASCDERAACNNPANRLDLCAGPEDEHFTFRPTQDGRWFVGIDDHNPAGGEYEVLVVQLTCDQERGHNETCALNDDGSPQTGCDRQCRPVIDDDAIETEPNDDFVNANVMSVLLDGPGTASARGQVGGEVCDTDWYAVRVPDGGSIGARLLAVDGSECSTLSPNTALSALTLIAPDGRTMVTQSTTDDPLVCPAIDPSMADGLEDSLYYLRVDAQQQAAVTTDGGTVEALAYQLVVEVTVP